MSTISHKTSDKLVPTLTIGFILLFILAALFDLSTFTSAIQSMFTSASATFGYWWQCLMIMNFALALIIAASRYGKVKMGGESKPTIGTFRWVAMIMCTPACGRWCILVCGRANLPLYYSFTKFSWRRGQHCSRRYPSLKPKFHALGFPCMGRSWHSKHNCIDVRPLPVRC